MSKCSEEVKAKARAYYYANREKMKAYLKEYYQKNKEHLNAKTRLRHRNRKTRQKTFFKANLDAPNEDPKKEKRRKQYLKAIAPPSVAEQAKEAIQTWVVTPESFTVTFD